MRRLLIIFVIAMMPSVLMAQGIEQEVYVVTPQGVKLYGSLLLPSLDVDASFPVALIVAGSGPTDRNGNSRFMVNNSLKMVAEGLCEQGIASLRYDKRGIGASYNSGLSEDEIIVSTFAKDLALWVDFLGDQDNLESVTLIGHSEGAQLAMMAMVDQGAYDDVDKLVLLAGAGRTSDVMIKESLIEQPDHIKDVSYQIIDSLKVGVHYDDVPLLLNKLFRPAIQNFLIESMQINPLELVEEIKKPVMIIQGTTDIQMTEQDARMLNRACKGSRLIVIKNMNHILKYCDTMDYQSQMLLYSNPNAVLSEELVPALSKFIYE